MDKEVQMKLLKSSGESIKEVLEQGIQASNIEFLDKVVDIHKDALEIQEMKGESSMRYGRGNEYGNYGNYGNYGENYGRGGYGNYGENYGRDNYGRDNYGRGGSYGRRGYDAKYRGDDMIDEMYQNYHGYSESRNYGAGEDSKRSLEYMMKSVVDFIRMLEQDASSQEEIEIIKKYTRQISEM